MKFAKWLKNLEKRGIISRTPHPMVLFILSFIALSLGFASSKIIGAKILEIPLYFMAGFGFLFSIGHFIVSEVLKTHSQ